MTKGKISVLLIMVCTLITWGVYLILVIQENKQQPINKLSSHVYVIKNVDQQKNNYMKLIKKDYDNQSFELSVRAKGDDLYLYTLAHSTTEHQEDQFGKWLTSFYGAEEK